MPVEWLATGILEDQHGPSTFANELKRMDRPCPVQILLQFIFMNQTIEGGRCWMFKRGQHRQYTGEMTVTATLSSAEDAFTILPQDMEVGTPICVEESKWIQLPHSSRKRGTARGPRKIYDIHPPRFIEPDYRRTLPHTMGHDNSRSWPGTQAPGERGEETSAGTLDPWGESRLSLTPDHQV